jgi:GT2 family glycosyltransferase
MLGRDAVGAVAAARAAVLRKLGGMRHAATAELAHYDMMLRVGGAILPTRIRHIPAVLCHRAEASVHVRADEKEAARAIVRAHLAETYFTEFRVEPAPLLPTANRVYFPLPAPAPLVSVVVPTRDRADMLARCTEGVLSHTDYPALELLIVDNDSAEPAARDLLASLAHDPRVRVLPYQGAFDFAAMNNGAVEAACGEVVVLLNNDTEIIEPGWLSELVSHAVRPDVGAVGAKLLYPDGRVQHCGVTLGPGLFLGHQLRLSARTYPGPHGELALLRSVSAVTGACLALRKAVYQEVGGLDAVRFKVALNDIDLCLRIADFGYRVVCTPFAQLIHHESATRGQDDTAEKRARATDELRNFEALWGIMLDADPFHNANVVFGWTETSLAAPPRRMPAWCAASSSPAALSHPASR